MNTSKQNSVSADKPAGQAEIDYDPDVGQHFQHRSSAAKFVVTENNGGRFVKAHSLRYPDSTVTLAKSQISRTFETDK